MNSSAIASSLSRKRSQASASSYSLLTYSGSTQAWFLKCEGYDDNTDNYPLIIFMPGSGAMDGFGPGTSFTKINNSGEGLGQYLLAGDRPKNVLICLLQNLISGSDFGRAEWDAIVTYMTANFRIDTNRMYATGLSDGAIGCENIFETRTNCAAFLPVSSPSFTTGWSSGISGIGFWQHQGTTDTTLGRTIGGTLYNSNGAGGPAIDLSPAPRTTYYYGQGHTSAVWDTQVYNRLERTDAPGTAKFDFVRFLKKFSLDHTQQATLFVENAEFSNDIVDYREALMLVNNLSSGGTKTALLSRLSTLKSIVDKGGVRYIISANQTGVTVGQTGINDWNATFAAGQGLTNIVDDTGGSSTLGVAIGNQFASSSRDNAAGAFNAGRSKYKGFKLEFNLGGLVLNHPITNGSLIIGNIPSGKKIDVLIHNSHITGDDDNVAISAESSISATMNSVTKTQYSEYNNAYYLQFTDVPEVSGSASLLMRAISTRDIIVQGFEILVHS